MLGGIGTAKRSRTILLERCLVWKLHRACRKLPEARAARRKLGNWETEWSFRHMCRLLRRITIREFINSMSHNKHDLQQLIEHLENYLYLAA